MSDPEIEEIDIVKDKFNTKTNISKNEAQICTEVPKEGKKNLGTVENIIIDKGTPKKPGSFTSHQKNKKINCIKQDFINDECTEGNGIVSVSEEDEIVALEEIKHDKSVPLHSHSNKHFSQKRKAYDVHGENAIPEQGEPNSKELKRLSPTEKSVLNGASDSVNTYENLGKYNANEGGEKIDEAKLFSYQIQCVNLHCKSGYGLAEAPVFVLTYFGAKRKKNILQKVCEDCFQVALKHQEVLAHRLTHRIPMFDADFPKERDVVVVMDPVEEFQNEENLPKSVVEQVEEHLMDVIKEALGKYDLEYQWDRAEDTLLKKFGELSDTHNHISQVLNSMEKAARDARMLIYKDFTPKTRQLPELNILGPDPNLAVLSSILKVKSVAIKPGPKIHRNIFASLKAPTKDNLSHDIVSVEEVEIPRSKLPPVGNLTYPRLCNGDSVYVMKISFFGIWVKGKVIEVLTRSADVSPTYRVKLDSLHRNGVARIVVGKHLAYSKPSPVRYPVGTRVIALFKDTDIPNKEAYYVGVIAEPPKHINNYRYLVFFDDGYAQYVVHENILQVCEYSRFVHEDIHPENREFIKNYLDQYPERPMVKLQKGQLVRTEWNGKWWISRVIDIDGSLAKLHFEANSRMEWIYRGSTRLGPLYSEFVAAAARKEQGGLSRHRSLGIASLKKRNMPYVEYSVDQDDAKTLSSTGVASKNVAKKSTTSKGYAQGSLNMKNEGPPKPHEVMEYTTKGYIRSIDISARKSGKVFSPHQCGPSCVDRHLSGSNKGINPLVRPLLCGFERQVIKVKGKRGIMYRAPCGRRLRNIIETHRYLRITKLIMGLDLFDFDPQVHVLDEFFLEYDMYVTYLTDISYGRENNIVSCVNEINHAWPSYMEYSTIRKPQGGVNICLDEEFLVCCDCTDDCLDKEKCECWQLTIEGARLVEGDADSSVGYQYKRLLEPVTTGIYECNKRCKCSSTCLNRVVQHPLQLNLQVFRTLKKGWGLRALNDIPQGGFICIYAGLLHTEQSANDDGRVYGDEYLAELDYIEVVERFKEDYESEVIEPNENSDSETEEDNSHDGELYDNEKNLLNGDDAEYIPEGLKKLPKSDTVVNTRARKKNTSFEKKSENQKEKGKKENRENGNHQVNVTFDEDDEMKKKPSKFTVAVPVDEERPKNYKSVREMFGDGADDCYIMDAKSSGNIGRYLNHSCQPNVFVQNVFVDTHDVRFPWVAFFALTHIKAGTELTWDYNYDVGSVPDKVLYCYCNNVDCRGRLL